MKHSIIFALLFQVLNLNAQSKNHDCDELLQKFEFPVEHSIQSPLTPDTCNALPDYGTNRVLRVAPVAGYLEVKKRIKVVSETTWDADNCLAQTTILSRDTITLSERKYPTHSDKLVGGYWTIRMELMVQPPNSRPAGSFATKLPKGAMSQTYNNGSTLELKDYWVVHTGQFTDAIAAKQACREFKKSHPEFCRAYAYWLPSGCEYQYEFTDENNL
jgi:hypothetical protein